MSALTKKFYLKVYDNYHYGDDSETYESGEFKTYEGAIKAAKAIVIEFLESNWKIGFSSDVLLSQYLFYGEDPVILPAEPGMNDSFSGRKFASEIVDTICQIKEKELSVEELSKHNKLKSEAEEERRKRDKLFAPVEKEVAKRGSYHKQIPISKPRKIEITLRYSKEQMEKIKRGFIPQGQDDKWFIFHENNWLFCFRSWTGYGMYKAHIVNTNGTYLIDYFFVETDATKYHNDNIDYEKTTFESLIEDLLEFN